MTDRTRDALNLEGENSKVGDSVNKPLVPSPWGACCHAIGQTTVSTDTKGMGGESGCSLFQPEPADQLGGLLCTSHTGVTE